VNPVATRWRNCLWWLIPALFPLAYFAPTLEIWFRADDFAWLGLRLSIRKAADVAVALFSPMAQGTVRFFSERAFFLTLESLFGLNALPFRMVVWAAAAGASVLLAWLLRRLTGSLVAAIAGPASWTISVGLAAAMGWLSSANQVFCALFFLGALCSFVAGRRTWCWVSFVLGLGSLETMVVLPVVALGYALLWERQRVREAALLLVPAAAFCGLHGWVIPKTQTDPAYRLYADPASLLDTLQTYWSWAARPGWPAAALAVTLMVVAVGAAHRRNWTVLFGLGWFVLMLAPVLPLREHRLHYYLGAPGVALGFTWGAAVAALGAAGPLGRLVAAGLLAIYATGQWPQSRAALAWNREKADAVRSLVRGVEAARRLHPGDTLLLAGISNTLFWDGIFDNPFRILGIDRIYLAPGAERAIDSHPEWGGINEWIIPAAAARNLFLNDRVQVYEPRSGILANVTAEWRPKAHLFGDALASFVDLGDPAFDRQLKDGWEDLFERSRWMGREAAVELSTENSVAGELVVSAWCPAALAATGPVEVEALVANTSLGRRLVTAGEASFQLVYPLPTRLRGQARAEVRLRASRTFRTPEDGRDLSFVFGTIQVR